MGGPSLSKIHCVGMGLGVKLNLNHFLVAASCK